MKCTYKSCPYEDSDPISKDGAAGITDRKMRPWHHECASRALGNHRRDWWIQLSADLILVLMLLITAIQHYVH